MVNRFGLAAWRNALIGMGVLASLPACIDAARTTTDVGPDSTSLSETADSDGGLPIDTAIDVTPDTDPVEVVEPGCVNVSQCGASEAQACNVWDCIDNECVMVAADSDARCTTDDVCTPRACSAGECVTSPRGDGESCDDGLYCNGTSLCKAGICAQAAAPCSETPPTESCVGSYACNETARGCDPVYRGPTAAAYLSNGLVSTESCGAGGDGLCVDQRCVPSDMRLVPAGVFRMGCRTDGLEGDLACEANAMPPHPVMLDTFAIGRFEASWSAWEACVARGFAGCSKSIIQAASPYDATSMASKPADYLTYKQAAALCSFQGRRLCTEAEWEKAARGLWNGAPLSEAQRAFPWGNSQPTCERATSQVACEAFQTTSVEAKPLGAGAFGAVNMAGNVAEWVFDSYVTTAYLSRSTSVPTVNPVEHNAEGDGVLRGGHARTRVSDELKTFRRVAATQNASLNDTLTWQRGVRCCADAPVDGAE